VGGHIYTAYSNRIESAIGEPAETKFASGFFEQEQRSRRVVEAMLRESLANLLRILNYLDSYL